MNETIAIHDVEVSLEEKYLEAVHIVEETYKEIPEEELIELYGLYKRIKDGEAPSKNPYYFYQRKETTKWKSWRQASNLSKEEAMSKYILLSAKYKSMSKEAIIGNRPLGFELPDCEDSSTSQAPVLDLCYFSAIGDISSIRYLLEKDPSSVHLKDESVVVLLEYEASVDAVDREGQSALHYACICEYPDVVLQLVKAGADIYLEDFQGQISMTKIAFLLFNCSTKISIYFPLS
ncbi:Acyl-CoA-binding domain-containing protein 6 [Galdieria sulphuraria]|nr:Acyl-CoA-binding domain-containing protein 6 [Galdieria sulphuraria]